MFFTAPDVGTAVVAVQRFRVVFMFLALVKGKKGLGIYCVLYSNDGACSSGIKR